MDLGISFAFRRIGWREQINTKILANANKFFPVHILYTVFYIKFVIFKKK